MNNKIDTHIADKKSISKLHKAGFKTLFDITKESFTDFSERTSMLEPNEQQLIYANAKIQVEKLYAQHRTTQLRNDPTLRGMTKLGIAASPQPAAKTDITPVSLNLSDYAISERSNVGYVDGNSIQSLFSPGHYLCELYRVAKDLHAVDSSWHIDRRRPDLKTLVLSGNNMQREVSTLDILLETLQSGKTEQKVALDELAETYYPITLPYDDNLTIIRAALTDKKTSLREIAHILFDDDSSLPASSAVVVQETLGLTSASYQLLASPQELPPHIVTDLYNCPTPNPKALNKELDDITKLSMGLGLSESQLITLLQDSDFVQYGVDNSAEAKKYDTYYLSQAGITAKQGKIIFTTETIFEQANKLNRFIRLLNATQLTAEQLNLLLTQINRSDSTGKDDLINEHSLFLLSEYVYFNRKYALTPEKFATLFGSINLYSRKDEASFYQKLFSSAEGTLTLSLNEKIDFNQSDTHTTIIASALKVTSNELTKIATYCFSEAINKKITMDIEKYSQIYRLALIPQVLQISFTQFEKLLLLSGKVDDIRALSQKIDNKFNTRGALDTLRYLEKLLKWMSKAKLDILSLQAMLTTQYSTTATPEMFSFLSNIYHEIENQSSEKNSNIEAKLLWQQKIYRSMAAYYHLKNNVMKSVIDWLEQSQIGFILESFAEDIKTLFKSNPSLQDLQKHTMLISQCQELSQYVLVAQWAKLTELDINLILNTKQLSSKALPIRPNMEFLILIYHLKKWQQRVKVSVTEAMQYFSNIDISLAYQSPELNELIESRSEKQQQLNRIINGLHQSMKDRLRAHYSSGKTTEEFNLNSQKQDDIISTNNEGTEIYKKLNNEIIKITSKIEKLKEKYKDESIHHYIIGKELLAKSLDLDHLLINRVVILFFNNTYPLSLDKLISLEKIITLVKTLNIGSEIINKINTWLKSTISNEDKNQVANALFIESVNNTNQKI